MTHAALKTSDQFHAFSCAFPWCSGVAAIAMVLLPATSQAQEVRGRVLDDASRQPIAAATATLLSGEIVLARVSTNASGFFQVRPPGAGRFTIAIEMLGYATERRELEFSGQDQTLPAILLKTQAVPVAPVEANVRRDRAETGVGFARSQHVVAGSRMAMFEQQAARPLTLVREISGLRVREYMSPGGQIIICIESRRGITSMRGAGGCPWPVLIVDGIKIADQTSAQETFQTLHVRDMESFEYMTPAEAGHRYGLEASAHGALVIWTRGRGPHQDSARNRK